MSARVTLILINEEYQIMTGDIVYKDLIQLDLDVRNTDELFEVMSGRLMELGYVTGDFLESIKEREKEYPTALPIEPYAVAIPHTDPECIKNAFIACIRLGTYSMEGDGCQRGSPYGAVCISAWF